MQYLRHFMPARISRLHLKRQQLCNQSFLVGIDIKWGVFECWSIDPCGIDLPFTKDHSLTLCAVLLSCLGCYASFLPELVLWPYVLSLSGMCTCVKYKKQYKHSLATKLGTPVQSNAIQYSRSWILLLQGYYFSNLCVIKWVYLSL